MPVQRSASCWRRAGSAPERLHVRPGAWHHCHADTLQRAAARRTSSFSVAQPFVRAVAFSSGRKQAGRPAASGAGSAGIVVDDSQAPLYRITFGSTVADEDILGLFASFREVWALGRRVVMLVQTPAKGLTAHQRKLVVSGMKAELHDYSRWVFGCAMVIDSSFSRGTYTALSWMLAPPFEQKVFATLEQAESWANSRVSLLLEEEANGTRRR